MPKQFGNKGVASQANRKTSFPFNFCGLVGRKREGSIAIFVFFRCISFEFLFISLFTFFKWWLFCGWILRQQFVSGAIAPPVTKDRKGQRQIGWSWQQIGQITASSCCHGNSFRSCSHWLQCPWFDGVFTRALHWYNMCAAACIYKGNQQHRRMLWSQCHRGDQPEHRAQITCHPEIAK